MQMNAILKRLINDLFKKSKNKFFYENIIYLFRSQLRLLLKFNLIL